MRQTVRGSKLLFDNSLAASLQVTHAMTRSVSSTKIGPMAPTRLVDTKRFPKDNDSNVTIDDFFPSTEVMQGQAQGIWSIFEWHR